jgi:cytoskeleton protein RodZ
MEMMDGSGATETTPTAGGGLAEIGTMLRRRREEVGQSLDAVSAATHIRAHYLKAIEDGRRRELPGTAYMIGYVRTYADYLGFDGDRLITDYHADLAGPRKKTEKKPEPEPAGLPQIQLSPITLVIALLAFGVAGYFAYGYFSDDEEPTVEQAAVESPPAPAPAETETASVPPPQPPAGSAPTGAEASPPGANAPGAGQVGGTTAETPAFPPAATEDQVPPEAEIAAAPDPSAEVTEESPPQPEAAQGETAPGAEGSGKIVVRAKLESWIQVTNAKKEVVFSRVLRAGETYTVPEEEGLTLTTGNAGGVEITVDGTKLKSFGTVGLVKRDIPLDPKKLKDGSAFQTRRVTSGSQ